MANDNTNNNTNSTEEVNKDEAPLIANKNKSILNQILYNIYQSSKDKTIFGNFTIEGYPNPDEKFKKEEKVFVNNIFSIGDVDTLGWGSDNQSPQVYITFGVLLAIIQTKIILHDNSKGSDTSIPLFRFDMNFNNLENDDNYILKLPGQFSSDPRICIIPYENTIPPLPDLKLEEFDINTELKKSSYWNVNNEPYVGRLAALFVNIDYLTKVLDDLPLDEENNVNILDFLKGVIKGITQALGGINKINITITEDGLIRFIEEIPQRLKEIEITEEKQYARFNVFGVKPGIEGSFITSINLDAEIPSSFAATVAIGSQSNGNQKSGNATAFSNYNKGLKDRIIPEKITGTETPDPNEDEEQKDQLVENFKKIFKVGASLRTPFGAIYNAKNWFPDNIDTLTNLNTTHASLMLGRLTQPDENGNQQLQSSFFLPFNFSIEMEGLSGMVLYEKFKISEEILPPSYEKGGVDIQIKGIDHTVNDKGWKTKLETQSVPAAKLSPISTPYPLNTSSGGGGTSTGAGAGAAAGAAVVAGEDKGVTSPNSYTVGDIYYDGPSSKKQIFIHHTAGGQNIENVVSGWNKRTDHVSTHFITNNSGQVERIFADEAWANHLGIKSSYFSGFGLGYQNLNKTSLGIEMCSFGGLKLVNGEYKTYVNSTIPANEVARPVDKNGKETTYKGYTYYHKYSNAHIENVRKIIVEWKNKYGIPFKYDYDTLFTYNKTPFTGAKGIYTHNSVRQDKMDVFPQKELIDMLKSISD